MKKMRHTFIVAVAIFLGLAGYVGAQSTTVPPLRVYSQGALTPLPLRYKLNMTGPGVNCVDDTGTSSTDCTVTSGGGSIGGGIASTQIAYGSGTNIITGEAAFTFVDSVGITLLGASAVLEGGTSGLQLQDSATQNSVLYLSNSVEMTVGGANSLTYTSAGVLDMTSSSGSCAASTGCFRYNGTNLQFAVNGGSWSNITSGGSTGNFTFSANTMDLSGSATMVLGSTNTSAITLGAPATTTVTSVGTAQTAGITLNNTTAATSGLQQNSPGLVLGGHAWTGSASNSVTWTMQGVSVTQSSTAQADIVFAENVNGGGANPYIKMGYDVSNGGPFIASAGSGEAGMIFSSNEISLYPAYSRGAFNNAYIFVTSVLETFNDLQSSLGTTNHRWNGLFNGGPLSCGYNTQSGTTYSAAATDCGIYLTNTSARTVTLPAASTMPAGGVLELWDASESATAANVSVARSGSDTINGGTGNVAVITLNADKSTCRTDGSSKWFCAINN